MIRTIPARRDMRHTWRGSTRIGDATAALAFNPVTAGVSAGVGLASSALSSWMNSIQISHNADTATTLIVNGLAQELQNLDNAYFGIPQRSCSDQRAALDAYDQAWTWLQSPSACGNPNYGSAGNRCISDRAPGGRYPWQSYYRDPIANDPQLANAGCDTSQEVLLPSLSTGTYVPSGVTAAGQLDTTTPATASPANSATSSGAAAPATSASVASTAASPSISPTWLLAAAAVVVGVIALR